MGIKGLPLKNVFPSTGHCINSLKKQECSRTTIFHLEVSSPGLDEPLKLHRQYLKNIGRKVEVLLKDGRKIEGKLLEVNETGHWWWKKQKERIKRKK